MKLATVSLDQKWEDKNHNLALCDEYLALAKAQGAELVIFPEMTLTGFSVENISHAEEYEKSLTIQNFAQLAIKYDIAIMFGLAICVQNNKVENTLLCISNEGSVISRYAKIHPFSFANEDENFISGRSTVITVIAEVKIGNSICYDLRFPELYREYALDVNVIVVVANWPASRLDHWKTLLKARAIENICFSIGVNRIGVDAKGINYISSSVIYDYDGNEYQPVYSFHELAIFDIDISLVDKKRSEFPALDDRKLL